MAGMAVPGTAARTTRATGKGMGKGMGMGLTTGSGRAGVGALTLASAAVEAGGRGDCTARSTKTDGAPAAGMDAVLRTVEV